MTRRALLAWEGGHGRGHLLTLKTVAEALGGRFAFDAALCRMEHASEIEPLCAAVYQCASLWQRDEPRRTGVGCATWGEFLGDIGFLDRELLAEQIGWWRDVMRVRRTSVVVADFAPCALLAARSLGVPSICIGVGYGCPPPGMAEFPVLIPDYPVRIYDETEMVAAVNAAGRPLGVPEIARLPEVYGCDDQLACTFAMLDPYSESRLDDLLPPATELAGSRSDGSGDEIFIYFSTTERDEPALMEAIENLGAPTRLFMPEINYELTSRLSARGVIVERAPVPPDEIVRRSRLILHAGQHGTLSLALAAGLPQIVVPQQLEQLFHARRAEVAGVLKIAMRKDREVASFRRIVREVLADDEIGRKARALSQTLRSELEVDARERIRRRILAVAG